MKYIFALHIVLTSLNGLSQKSDKSYLDSLLIGFEGDNPGISAIIIKDGKRYQSIQCGYANIGKKEKVVSETRFNLASVSKHITAYWIFSLAKEGKISIDDSITKFIELPEIYNQIKIKHLLNHTSGLREFHTIRQLRGKKADRPFKDKEILKYLKEYNGLSFKPGTKHLYSNTGYYLLYKIAEKIDRWDEFASSIGLKSAFWEDGTKRRNLASLYAYNTDFSRVKFSEKVGGYSNCYMSADDLSLMMKNLLNNESFINALSRRDSVHNEELPYSLGLIRKSWDKYEAYYHGGIIKGTRTFIVYVPSLKVSVSILINSDVVDPEPYAYKILEGIINGKPSIDPGFLIQGQVVNNNNEPVPYCNIYAAENKAPIITDHNGYFSYKIKEFSDSLRFSSNNYESRTMSVYEFSSAKEVKLIAENASNFSTNDSEGIRWNNYAHNPEHYSFAPYTNIPGAEIIKQFKKLSHTPELIIDSLHVFITSQGNPHGKFRYIIYKFKNLFSTEGDMVYQSRPLALDSSLTDGWHHHAIDENVRINGEDDTYIGIQWLEAPGVKGNKGVFVGFSPDKKSNDGYYRVPFDHWRSVGELMYRGPKDLLIDISSHTENETDLISQKRNSLNVYMMDTMYKRVRPYNIGLGYALYTEMYPNSRVYSFQNKSAISWGDSDWKYEAFATNRGMYAMYEVINDRLNHDYDIVTSSRFNLSLKNDSKWRNVEAFNGQIKWKVKREEDRLIVKLNCFRKMVFKHYADHIYFLPGDHSFGRLLFLTTNKSNEIVKIEYVDSRNLNIDFRSIDK